MMQVGEPPFQKCAFSNLPLSSCFVHFLSLLHFCKASKMCMMSWGKHFWWAFTLEEPTPLKLIGQSSYNLRLAQEVLTIGAHYLQKLPCHRFGFSLHGLEMNHFISFLFFFISFKLWFKPPFKFSLPHHLTSNLAYSFTQNWKSILREMCVSKCEQFFLTHTQNQLKLPWNNRELT